jgi:hypothetical protein
MLPIHRLVHRPHLVRAHLARQRVQAPSPNLGPPLQGLIAHQRHRLIRRKVMLIVRERRQPPCRLDGPIGRIRRDHVHLMRRERAIQAAPDPSSGASPGKLQPVRRAQPRQPVRPLLEFIRPRPAAIGACIARPGSAVVNCSRSRVVPADHHRKRILKPQRRFHGCNLILRLIQFAARSPAPRCGSRSTGCFRIAVSAVPRVLHVRVDPPRHHRLLANVTAGEIKPPLHLQSRRSSPRSPAPAAPPAPPAP